MPRSTREWNSEHSPLARDYDEDVWFRLQMEQDIETEERSISEAIDELYRHAWHKGFAEGQEPPYPNDLPPEPEYEWVFAFGATEPTRVPKGKYPGVVFPTRDAALQAQADIMRDIQVPPAEPAAPARGA